MEDEAEIRELDQQMEKLEVVEQDMLENARQSRFGRRLQPTRRLQEGD